VPQPVVIVEVLVAQRHAKHPLPDQRPDLVFHQRRLPAVPEALGKPSHQPDRPVGRAQQQRSGIRTDRTAVERRLDTAAFDRGKTKQIRATLCRHRGYSLGLRKSLRHNNSRKARAPMHLFL